MVPERMLVVDDDDLVAWALQRAAMALKVPVSVAMTGAEALAAARTSGYGLAFVDIRLPDADGVELVPTIRASNPGARIVVITSDATPGNRERAYRVGAWHFLEKPFEMAEVSRLINECFRKVPERRSEEREICRFEVRVEIEDASASAVGSFHGSALDVSRGGLRLQTVHPLSPGQRIRVRAVPGQETVHLRHDKIACVVWTRHVDGGCTAGLAYLV